MEQKKAYQANYRAINLHHFTLSVNEYNRVSSCIVVKEIWERLETTYERTDQVHKSKVRLLKQEYEVFKMKDGETISEMITRFNKVTNELRLLEKGIPQEYKVDEILRSLPKSWEAKVTIIKESKILKS